MKIYVRPNHHIPVLALALWTLCLGAVSPPNPEETQKWEQLMTGTMKALRGNNVSESVRLCDEAIRLAGKFGPADTRLSQSQVLRAEVYMWEKRNDLAEQTFKQAIASCENAAGSNDVALVHPLSSLANFYFFVAVRYDQVIPLFQRILNIVENAPQRNNRDIIMWSRNLGMVYQKTGRYAEGEPLFKQAVALSEQTDAEWLPHELLTSADFYRAWGKYDQAEGQAKRALAIREQALQPAGGIDAQLDVAVCLNGLGAIYLAGGKPDKAEAADRRALNMIQTFMSPDQADLEPYLEGLAAALRAQGKYDQAEPLYQRALAITGKNLGADNLDTAALLEKYAGLLKDMKRPAEAKALLERAKMIRDKNTARPD
jgi:tetratricopeptide (TPR) repeat protein